MAKKRDRLRHSQIISTTEKPKKKRRIHGDKMSQLSLSIMGIAFKVLFFVIVFSAVIFGVRIAYSFGYAIFAHEDSAEEGQQWVITIQEDTDVWDLAKDLEEAGLIKNKYVFYAQYKFFEYKLVPGSHYIYEKMSSRAILDCLSEEVTEDEQ